jgi:SAM-dependent methyltransferase
MTYAYIGTELDLFAAATRWKSYIRHQVSPHIGRDVLEVGAGLGGTTRSLARREVDRWLCLEPDPSLADLLLRAIESGELSPACQVRVGTLADLDASESFDTLLYMDVLEHIEDDRAEMARAAALLRPGGRLIVLCPAHQWLFSPFDRSIGHFRRYTKRMFREITPPDLKLARLVYLDAVGLLASLGNKLVLRSSMPNPAQIAAWDRFMVPFSRLADPLLGHTLGKSVLGIWRKQA